MNNIQIGLETLSADPPRRLSGKRLGLLTNQAAVDHRLVHSRTVIDNVFPNQIKVLFSPQHGFFGEKQDNMIPSADMIDPLLNTPVFSLYGETRKPTAAMFEPIDTLMVDLQDVGTRVYTFVYTLAYCMEAAARLGKEVVVLDRPNPVGGAVVEGNCLKKDFTSFVGLYPIPMRHGMTIGELARLFNDHFGIGCPLTVVPLAGWKRHMYASDTDMPWIPPSPNLPTPESALVYPGQVLWEGTNVSEGRGTTQPFEIFGAPFIDTDRILHALSKTALPGVHLRPLAFEPTSNKWMGQVCFGFQIHVIERERYRPYFTTLAIMDALFGTHRDAFAWKSPPYEYEYEKLPFDLITGDPAIREAIEGRRSIEDLEKSWRAELAQFEALRATFLLYD